MKNCKPLFLAAVSLFAGLAITVQASAQSQMSSLDTGAKAKFITIEAPGAGKGSGQGTAALQISPSGVIVGQYSDANSVFHGYVRASDGTYTKFDPPGSSGTNAWSINPRGNIAGYALAGVSVSQSAMFKHAGR